MCFGKSSFSVVSQCSGSGSRERYQQEIFKDPKGELVNQSSISQRTI